MPIKFRCQHCRQFLGIARKRAGEVVDCPTCGRAIRVPQLDGKRKPIPDPRLDHRDSKLIRALDELAMIGREDEQDVARENMAADNTPAIDQVDDTSSVNAVIESVPVPEPIPVDPPLPVEPVHRPPQALAPAVSAAASQREVADNLETGNFRQPDSTRDELAALAASHADTSHPAISSARGGTTSGRIGRRPVLVVAMVCLVALVFVSGYLLGRSQTNQHPADAAESDGRSIEAEENNGHQPGKGGLPAAAKPIAIEGRISYESFSGERKPDRGARVIVFPASRSGKAKLSATGFRAADAPADFEAARAFFRVLGGDVATVDVTGHFEIRLPAAGNYRILVLSHFQARNLSEPIPPELGRLLAEYFQRPTALLGRLGYRFAPVRYKGQRAEIWDHSFEKR